MRPFLRSSSPHLRVCFAPQNVHDFSGLRFHQVEERIQAHRIEMDYVNAERAEAVRRVEARFAHRPVTLVEQRCELIGFSVVILPHVVIGDLVRAEILAD